MRDGNQSLLGGSLGAAELLPLAELLDEVGFHSLEAWGGATFEAYLRRGEDPWSYLSGLRKATPKTPIQALLRGQNLVGSHNYGDDVVELFIGRARALGVDIFRVFDPLNDLRNMEAAIGYARASGARVQGALCYAISPAHTLDGWIVLGKGLGAMEVDEIVIKDTSGLLSPQATWELVTGLVRAVGLPVVVQDAAPVEFWRWRQGVALKRGHWNIPVPPERDVVTPDVLVVPLVGFDSGRYRLGYGGGFYDRTLAAATPRPHTIGIAFTDAELPTIYPQPHDIPMDVIATDQFVREVGIAKSR